MIASLWVACTVKEFGCLLSLHVYLVQVKEKDTAWFVKFCVPWCKHWLVFLFFFF